jgi:hypothetical protein
MIVKLSQEQNKCPPQPHTGRRNDLGPDDFRALAGPLERLTGLQTLDIGC